MFFGTFEHTMDAKGRVSLPSRFRAKLGDEEIILVRGFENCLWLFKLSDYEQFLDQFNDTAFDSRKRQLQRWFMAGAFDVELDTAGRIRVPASMQQYADLDKTITITGNQSRIELWNPDAYERYIKAINIDELTDELVADGVL